MTSTRVWDVALLSPPYSTLTYAQPGDFPDFAWHPGQRVVVPVRREVRTGVLLDRVGLHIDPSILKHILWPLEANPLFPSSFLRLVQALSVRSVTLPGQVMASVVPSGVKSQAGTFINRAGQRAGLDHLLTLDEEERSRWVAQWTAGELWFQAPDRQQQTPQWNVACNPPWPLRPQAVRQQQVLDYLWSQGPQSGRHMTQALGNWASRAVKELAAKGLIVAREPLSPPELGAGGEPSGVLELSPDQSEAFSELHEDIVAREARARLLFGVTGSGKTLVYARLARTCLEHGRSVLLLVPEVALATQIYAQIQRMVPDVCPVLYHGSLPAARRAQIYSGLSRQTEPVLAVGTRSAVFLPRPDWGLIILDEEHDASFKQEERFTYQAKEVAYFLHLEHKALLLLGSATPDIRTFHAAQKGQLGLLSLPERISGHDLPQINVVDLLHEPEEDGPFSPRCRKALEDCLQRGEQAIVLLNRRGYAPLVYCTSCAQVVRCEHCAVGLTYHKGLQRLVCHYCGHIRPFPSPCTSCGGNQFVPLSHGTEQIDEYLRSRLDPEMTILRLDRDSTRPQGSMEDILERFTQGRAQVLVGTQMCSKGHNFPQVTLVIVVDGDVGLNLPDYRATERTFQLLVQVAGRAGRGERPGTVYIQTRNPDHYCWRYVQAYDFRGFYSHEIGLRQRMNYPPFVKLALVRLTVPEDSKRDTERVKELGQSLRRTGKEHDVQVLGPAPAPLSRLRGRLRYQCLLKASSWSAIRSVYSRFRAGIKRPGRLRISLDIDPVQML